MTTYAERSAETGFLSTMVKTASNESQLTNSPRASEEAVLSSPSPGKAKKNRE
jgi:hypothetical protein